MYRIWFKTYKNGVICAFGVSTKRYVYKKSAERAATKMYGISGVIREDGLRRDWLVSEECPFESVTR